MLPHDSRLDTHTRMAEFPSITSSSLAASEIPHHKRKSTIANGSAIDKELENPIKIMTHLSADLTNLIVSFFDPYETLGLQVWETG